MKDCRAFLHVALAIIVCCSYAAPSNAGGLINNLPADGSYVIFRAKQELDIQGNLQAVDREIKLASVGKQPIDDEPGRWIELSTDFGGRRFFAKLLIAERYLKGDQNPFDHVAKSFARGPDGETVSLSTERLRHILTFGLPVSYFQKLDKRDSEKIRTPVGEYDCDILQGEGELDGPMDSKIKVAGDIWVNDKVPFGLVKARVKSELTFGTIETDLELIKSGTDATSELPD